MLDRLAAALLTGIQQCKTGGVIVNEHWLTAADMRARVDMLGRWFEFIHHDDLLPRLGQRRPKPFCLLTFDDGKKSNFTRVAPELERLGVPAVFYVTSGFIDSAQPLWFDRYEALRHSSKCSPGLAPHVVKKLPLGVLRDLLARELRRTGIDCDLSNEDIGPMSWEEVSRLARRGFTIGAHTVDHPVLTALSETEAKDQIDRSIRAVRDHVGTCPSFAFTNGNYTARLARQVMACGAQTAVTTEPVWANAAFPPWRLPRVQLHPGQGTTKMAFKLAAAAVPGLLRNPDGSGRVYLRVQRLQRRHRDGSTTHNSGPHVAAVRDIAHKRLGL